MRNGICRLAPVFGLVLAMILPAAALADGTQTGIVAGDVVDAEGVHLPGVQVTATGPQGSRTAVTDDGGRFRFPALALGTYQVSAELLGLRTTALDVEVFLGKTTEVRLRLGPEEEVPVASASESIQVVAEAPLIDRFDTRVGTSVRFEFLDKLPVQRFYQSVALALPGVSGGEDGNPNVSGALRSSNLFLVDGVDTTDPVTGLFGLNLNYEAVQEVSVSTASLPAEYGRASGAVINVVTRSGSNEYQGSARWLGTNNDWNESYDYAEDHLAPDLAAANSGPDDVDQTVALSAGGPVREDRLWFFAAYEDGEASLLSPSYQNLLWNQGAATESAAVKLTWQPTPASTLVGQYTSDSSRFATFNPFNRGPAENRIGSIPIPLRFSLVDRIPGDLFALHDQSQDGDFSKLQWNTAFSQNFSAELTLARQQRELERQPLNSRGLTGDAPHVSVTLWDYVDEARQEMGIQEVILFNGITDRGFERRPRQQGNLAVNGFFEAGSTDHEVKVGIDVQRTDSERRFNFAGSRGPDKATRLPVEGRLYFDLDTGCPGVRCSPFDTAGGTFVPWLLFNFFERPTLETREETAAAYLSDTVLFGRWLVSLGARLERVEGEDAAGLLLVDDQAVAPRLAVSYDARGDGTVLFTATWGRYVEPFLQQYLDSFADLETFSGYTVYIWGGAIGVDCTGQDPNDPGADCWLQGSEKVDLFGVQAAPPNLALRSPKVDELVVGFERQITKTTGISLHYVDREWNDLWDNVYREDRDPETGDPLFISQIRNLPFARRSYQAIQLLVQKRWADNWQLLGSYTRGKTEGNLFQTGAFSTFADFAERTDANLVNRFGPAPYDRRHQIKLLGQYLVPLGRAGLSIGNVVRYESGVPFQTEAWDPYGVRFVTKRGSERLPEVFQWDLGFTLDFPLASGMGLEARAEVFNVTGERRVLGVETLLDTGLSGRPRSLLDLQAPRSYRFGLGFRF